MNIKNQLRSVIQWENPQQDQLFIKFTDNGDEIKNASKLIIGPGQGCLFTYEGKIEAIFEEEGLYDLKTDNIPFLTTIKKFITFFGDAESEHKTGLWFYKKTDMLNIRWGTRSPIKYDDPVYTFPVRLRTFGNYSIKITEPKNFFTQVVGGLELFTVEEIQEIFVSRIVQPITNYLANAKFSYAEIDSNVNEIANYSKKNTEAIFKELGFQLLDFRIEGTSFDDDTEKRIGRIADVNAEVQAAKLAGLDYTKIEQLKALRDAAKNEGGIAGIGAGLGAGMQVGSMMGMGQNVNTPNQSQNQAQQNTNDPLEKLKKLKEMFEIELISEEEYKNKKQEILKDL
ncbi:SPFH domain-containing protein [Flavivirga spongiicola]|uniref:SPFH domain-containing protein n=1 Tax=Flavivirga spongiicola TaxID=421621 RepID=A0ABU7XNJ0_9FLAO|nr:SPFH domain-containing protein [Flavivirga sp. MEBiC05379]MDO5977330.1 SPFH domain-containing protein [Flavivirga sp. MEBiC05379]